MTWVAKDCHPAVGVSIIATFSLQEIERRLLQLELLKKARMQCELQDDADVRFDLGKTVGKCLPSQDLCKVIW